MTYIFIPELPLISVLLLIRNSYTSWSTWFICKTVCELFHFRFRLVLIELGIFVQQKPWTLWQQNLKIPLK